MRFSLPIRLPLSSCLRATMVLTVACCFASPLRADPLAPPNATEVKVERVRPKREKHPTLQFLKENRDFIRARFDLLREKPLDSDGGAAPIDARFLAYQRMLNDVRTGRDSVATAEEARARQTLFASVTELGRLESELDLTERLLAEQRGRLAVLQEDFTGRQQTALVIVVSGYPAAAAVAGVALTLEDGATLTVPLTPEQRESLRKGGVLQVFHALVEPRQQVLQIALVGEDWPADGTGYVTLEPVRDRLTFLLLSLTPAQPGSGASSILASTWIHDAGLHSGEGTESIP